MKYSSELAQMIDHTLLKADATEADIIKLCQEAVSYNFWSVCLNPFWIPRAVTELRGTSVRICTVVGFPLGATSTTAKIHETTTAVAAGANEIDMVINVGALKSKRFSLVLGDMRGVVNAAKAAKADTLVKVILETCLLSTSEKLKACELALEANADYLKTSTGFNTSGATVEDIKLIRQACPGKGIKASGGIRDKVTAEAMLTAGATRIGTSSGIKIVTE